ncbi:MAG TPA: DUF362 domain-containing protein [Anaerolineae bacterium]|nr:DUF362 domain-containing protein [Anaerolineae bacterium]
MAVGTNPLVSVVTCETYDLDAVRRAVTAALAPLGGIERYVRPGMRVLLKPNLLAASDLDHALITHPAVVQAVAEQVQAAGGTVLIGDSPAGPVQNPPPVWRRGGLTEVARRTGATLVPFDGVEWRRKNGHDYFIARPVFDADLIINLPKLKTHTLTLYTGAVKNLFGTIPGTRKREVHYRAPGVPDFSQALVDVLELVRPGLTLLDGVLGQEGEGPGRGGTPRRYNCLAASDDPVALDAVITDALGYRSGEVVHVAQAAARGLGVADLGEVRVVGERRALDFGEVALPRPRWYFQMPAWMGAPVRWAIRIHPQLDADACIRCGQCAAVCPADAIAFEPRQTPKFDLNRCIRCFCCAEVCPQGAITPYRNLAARLFGVGE